MVTRSRLRIVLLTLAGLAFPRPLAAATWQSVRGSPLGISSVVVEPRRHRLFAFGSADPQGAGPELWSLSLDSLSAWQRVDAIGPGPAPRISSLLFADPAHDQILFFGGRLSLLFANSAADLWSLDLSGRPTWQQLAPSVGGPTYGSSGAAALDLRRGQLLSFSGSFTHGLSTESTQLTWKVGTTPATSWTLATTTDPPSARSVPPAACDSVSDRLIVTGGKLGFAPWNTDTWALDLSTGTWQQLPSTGPYPPEARSELAWQRRGQRTLNVIAGPTMWSLDLSRADTAAWSSSPVQDPGLYPFGNAWDEAGQTLWKIDPGTGELWRLVPDGTRTWSRALQASLPPSRYGGERLVLDPAADRSYLMFGFDSKAGVPATGGNQVDGESLLDWSPFAVAPGPRLQSSVVLDAANHRFLAFGGTNGGLELDELWEYRIDSQAWSLIAPSGSAPSARAWHSAVIDSVGRRMIVFGGMRTVPEGFQTLADTWAFALDGAPGWTRLDDAPVERGMHSATWDETRHRMLVVGGHVESGGSGSDVGDVWEWVPGRSPAWILQVPDGAPGDIRGHVAILDPPNRRLITFGGNATPSSALRSFQLDLPTLTWRDLPNDNTPGDDAQSLSGYFDSLRRRAVLFHGRTSGPSDVWTLALGDTAAPLSNLLSSGTSGGRVEVEWLVGGTPMPMQVLCVPQGKPSRVVSGIVAGPDDIVRFVDASAAPGDSIDYDLQANSGGSVVSFGTAHVRVPGQPPVSIASILSPISPALSSRALVRCSIPDAAPTKLEVYDITGRKLLTQEVGFRGPGAFTVALDRRFDAGMYIVRMKRADGTLKARLVVSP